MNRTIGRALAWGVRMKACWTFFIPFFHFCTQLYSTCPQTNFELVSKLPFPRRDSSRKWQTVQGNSASAWRGPGEGLVGT